MPITDDDKWNNLKPTLRSLGLVKETIPEDDDDDDDLEEEDESDEGLSDEFDQEDFDDDEDEVEEDDDDEAFSLESIRRRRNKRRKQKRLKRKRELLSLKSNELGEEVIIHQEDEEHSSKIIHLDEASPNKLSKLTETVTENKKLADPPIDTLNSTKPAG